MVLFTKIYDLSKTPFQYQWINDNKEALAWAYKDKCSSLASQSMSQIHMFTKLYKQDPDFLQGEAMGEIDKMSRMEDGETIDSIRIQRECPSLLPSLKIEDMSSNPLIDEIFKICNPSNQIDQKGTF